VFGSEQGLARPSGSRLFWLRCAGEDGVVFRRKHLDEDLTFVGREDGAAASCAGVFAGEVVGEDIAVPRRELVISAAWGETQDQAVVFDGDFERPEILIGVLADVGAERLGGSGALRRSQRGIVWRRIVARPDDSP
jgi:hypothetical protein